MLTHRLFRNANIQPYLRRIMPIYTIFLRLFCSWGREHSPAIVLGVMYAPAASLHDHASVCSTVKMV